MAIKQQEPKTVELGFNVVTDKETLKLAQQGLLKNTNMSKAVIEMAIKTCPDELHDQFYTGKASATVFAEFKGNTYLVTVKHVPKQKPKDESTVDATPVLNVVGVVQAKHAFEVYQKCAGDTKKLGLPYSEITGIVTVSSISEATPKKTESSTETNEAPKSVLKSVDYNAAVRWGKKLEPEKIKGIQNDLFVFGLLDEVNHIYDLKTAKAVARYQLLLYDIGLLKGKDPKIAVDGKFGSATEKASKTFIDDYFTASDDQLQEIMSKESNTYINTVAFQIWYNRKVEDSEEREKLVIDGMNGPKTKKARADVAEGALDEEAEETKEETEEAEPPPKETPGSTEGGQKNTVEEKDLDENDPGQEEQKSESTDEDGQG